MPLFGPLRAALSAAIRAELEAGMRDRLVPRFDAVRALRGEVDALRRHSDEFETALGRVEAARRREPVTVATTVHDAHARHPGVQALFARRGLPACPDCAVGADETLAEAALGEGLVASELVEEINRLLG